MDEESKALLRRIAESNERILWEIAKPQRVKERAIAILTTAATAGGVMSAVDLIIKWLGGSK